jgi:hypothetical protein
VLSEQVGYHEDAARDASRCSESGRVNQKTSPSDASNYSGPGGLSLRRREGRFSVLRERVSCSEDVAERRLELLEGGWGFDEDAARDASGCSESGWVTLKES